MNLGAERSQVRWLASVGTVREGRPADRRFDGLVWYGDHDERVSVLCSVIRIQQDFTFFKVKLSKKILKLKKLINKILHPYSFLCLEFMAYKKEKILAPFL